MTSHNVTLEFVGFVIVVIDEVLSLFIVK